MSDDEIVSVLRNWTVGELSTISASIGIVVHFLAQRRQIQSQLRNDGSTLGPAIDEILRIDAPLITSRRITTCPVKVGGQSLVAGDRLTLMWSSANRDEAVFGNPDEFRIDRDPSLNLLYGSGIHVCPGAPLARLELRVMIEELLNRTQLIEMHPTKQPERALYPAAGFTSLPIVIQR